jgi:hypothetical protein
MLAVSRLLDQRLPPGPEAHRAVTLADFTAATVPQKGREPAEEYHECPSARPQLRPPIGKRNPKLRKAESKLKSAYSSHDVACVVCRVAGAPDRPWRSLPLVWGPVRRRPPLDAGRRAAPRGWIVLTSRAKGDLK